MEPLNRILSLVIASAALLASPDGVRAEEMGVDRNVVYGMYSGLALVMDVHHPAQPNGYGIVFISGSE